MQIPPSSGLTLPEVSCEDCCVLLNSVLHNSKSGVWILSLGTIVAVNSTKT
jgi:hypothetical protein